MKNATKKVVQYFKIIIILSILFICGKMLAYSLPADPIKTNIIKSMQQFEYEGVYPTPFYSKGDGIFVGQRLDNWTDAEYLNVAYSASYNTLIKSIAGDYRMKSEMSNPTEGLIQNLEQLKNGGELPELVPYARQWFGTESILRIGLYFFTYPQIRIINQYLFILLFVLALYIISQRINLKASIAFLLAMTSVNIYIIPSSINLCGVFYIIILGAIYISVIKNEITEGVIMFIIGALTSYFDLFVAPLASFAVLSQLVLIKKMQSNDKFTFSMAFFSLIKCSVGWVCGYLTLWSVKWAMASLVLRQNMFLDAMKEMIRFSSAEKIAWAPDTKSELLKETLRLNFSELFPFNIVFDSNSNKVYLLIFISIVFIGFAVKCKLNIEKQNIIFLIASMSPYVWYIFVHTHSFVHFWFTYRVQAGAVFGLVYFILILGNYEYRFKKFRKT